MAWLALQRSEFRCRGMNRGERGRLMKRVVYLILSFTFIMIYNLGYPEETTNPNEARLREIAQRKEELVIEREKLQKEIEQFNMDLQAKGRLMYIREKREMEKRQAEIQEKIKRFNEELDNLNQEEQRLLGLQKPMGP